MLAVMSLVMSAASDQYHCSHSLARVVVVAVANNGHLSASVRVPGRLSITPGTHVEAGDTLEVFFKLAKVGAAWGQEPQKEVR